MSNNSESKWKVLVKSSVYGSATALASLPFEHPFDAVKTNMQSSQLPFKDTVALMTRRKGWRAFYNGFAVNSVRVMIKQAYRWPLWISVSAFYKKYLPNTPEMYRQTVTGFSISFLQLLVLCPFERLKIWLMTTKTQQETKLSKYFQFHQQIYDLYTGFVPLLVRQGLSWASFLASSEILKTEMMKLRNTDRLQHLDLFLVCIPVSIINTAFIMPMDCIKTFYQSYEGLDQKQPFLKTVTQMIRKYKFRGLYLGWEIRICQYMIQSAFTLIVIEQLHRQYQNKN